jgi:large subunit ribosomal protein L19
MDIMKAVEKDIMPVERTINFEIGDTVKVHYRIVEGDKERIQIFEGIVIAIDNKGINKTFTVRKISFEVGVERVFPSIRPESPRLKLQERARSAAPSSISSGRDPESR